MLKNGRPKKQEQIDVIKLLRTQGKSYNEIARAIGVQKARVQYVVKHY